MHEARQDRALRALYAQSADAPAPDAALEARLLERHRALYPRRGWLAGLSPSLHPARALLVALLALLLGAAACSLPSSYDVEVGKAMAIQFSSTLTGPSPALDAALADVESYPGVEAVAIDEFLTEEGTRFELRLMGQDLDGDALVAEVTARHPLLAEATISTTPIDRAVKGPLYEKLGHELFGWTFDFEFDTDDDPAVIEAQIREQLEEQGFDGDAQVEVLQGDEPGTVELRLEMESTEGDDAK